MYYADFRSLAIRLEVERFTLLQCGCGLSIQFNDDKKLKTLGGARRPHGEDSCTAQSSAEIDSPEMAVYVSTESREMNPSTSSPSVDCTSMWVLNMEVLYACCQGTAKYPIVFKWLFHNNPTYLPVVVRSVLIVRVIPWIGSMHLKFNATFIVLQTSPHSARKEAVCHPLGFLSFSSAGCGGITLQI